MQELIGPYLDGELDLMKSVEVEHHLHGCAICAPEYDNLRALRPALSAPSLRFKPPADLQKRVQSAVRKANREKSGGRFLSWQWIPVAASIALLLAAIAAFVFLTPSRDELLARDAVASHV